MAAVIEQKQGRRIRLRDTHPLPVSVDIDGKATLRVTLQPNQWMTVPEPIYQLLRSKFTVRRSLEVPDFEANERSPHKAGQPALTRTETNPGYVIEGLDD